MIKTLVPIRDINYDAQFISWCGHFYMVAYGSPRRQVITNEHSNVQVRYIRQEQVDTNYQLL